MSQSIRMNQVEEYILSNICKEIGTNRLIPAHERYVLKLFRSMDPNVFKGYKISKIGPILGKVLGDKLNKLIFMEQRDINNIDIREYQKLALGSSDQDPNVYGGPTEDDIKLLRANKQTTEKEKSLILSDFLGINDLNEFKMMFNPESMYVHYYLVLDSDYRNTTEEVSSNITKFTWKYAPTQYTGTGFCNSVGVIRDVIGMRMYQPRVPYRAAMDTDAKRVSVLIEEFASQAFIAENGRRFHFLLRPNFITGQSDIELSTEDYNDGIFNFRKPITTIDSFTLSFGDPLNVISFNVPFNRFIVPFEIVCLKSDK
jgi:hypothetical protein